MKTTNIILAICLTVFTSTGFAQQKANCNQDLFTDTLLTQLEGQWTATGSIGTEKVFYQFSNRWVLNHQFFEMTFADTATVPKYTARVFMGFDCKNARYVIHWMDNFGGAFSETLGYGEKNADSIEMHFNYSEGLLVNTFTYDLKKQEWTSNSVIKSEGKWVTFGNIRLKKNQP